MKTTHKLQPLDVGVFSVLQCAWSAHSGDLAAKRITIDRHNFIPEYLAVWEKAITPELIIKAFRKTGISPFNPSMFLEEDFGPSMASSLGLHLPTSYPDLTPSSPPAIPTDDEDSDDDFIPGHSSDVEMDSGNDKDNSDDKGCEVEDDFTHVDPDDEMQATPLLNSDMPQTTPTDILTAGKTPEHSSTSMPPELPGPPQASLPDRPPALSTQSYSSSATPTSKIPDWEKTKDQLLVENYDLHHKLSQKDALLKAAEAHCMIMTEALADANRQIASMAKKKMRGTTKIKARWVALPELKDAFEAEEASRKEQERCNAEKEAQKQADHHARQSQIIKDTVLKVFDRPLTTYKRKDELIVLAGALELDTTGIVPALKERIKTYLDSHKNELMQNPRFMGLFQARRQHTFDGENCNGDLSGEAGPSGL